MAGGGSISFEALRLGYNVIANELNPVGTVILFATLDYPSRYGLGLAEDIKTWGNILRKEMVKKISSFFIASKLPSEKYSILKNITKGYREPLFQRGHI